MPLTQLLPTRLRVALRAARTDARDVVRAFTDRRHKVARVRDASQSKYQVTVAPRSSVVVRTPTPAPDVGGFTGGTVEFASSGVTLELDPDETILEAGLRHGVDLLFSCTMGGCGACMLQLREGEVGYEDPDGICLTEDEVQDGLCLACVGRPRGHVVVEA